MSKESPDHSTCRNCGQRISWDDYSYTHDSNGFADCGIVISEGTRIGGCAIDPNIRQSSTKKRRYAEPMEWDK